MDKNAGFWLRVLAVWLDMLVVYTGLEIVFYTLLIAPFTVYFPFEFTFLMLFPFYSTGFIYWKGHTIGKWLLNLTVVDSLNNEKLPFIKVVLRETVLKFLSALFLFIGFFWVSFSKNKVAWHDIIIHSKVCKTSSRNARSVYSRYLAIILFVSLSTLYIYEIYNVYYVSGKFKLPPKASFLYMKRSTNEVSEISNISTANDTIYKSWIIKNGKSAKDYFIDISSKHQLVIVGEVHEVKNYLDFFNEIIPDLYHKSGVRCIALECVPCTMNKKIEKLISEPVFDSNLALDIARNQPWSLWGFKEYWDILETVWRLNKNLTNEHEKMRIIGIDEDWEGPYFAYLTTGDDKLEKVSMVEKLKAPFLIDDFSKLIFRDELMAFNIEKEIIMKNIKGVVWIGADHSSTKFARPIVRKNKIITTKPRMGVLLKKKYGNGIFQIGLYRDLKSSESSCFNTFIEDIFKISDENGIAFSLNDSPFANLRDSNSDLFSLYPTITFQDLFEGFIYLTPLDQLQKCTWSTDYISKDMFMKYKPFYCNKLKHEFSDAGQMNMFMHEKYVSKK